MARAIIRELIRLNHPHNLSSNPCNSFCTSSPINNTTPHHPTLLHLLQSCKTINAFKQIQAQFITTGLFQHPIAGSRILKFCTNSTNLGYAILVFRQIDSPDTFTWNTMIKSYSQSNDPRQAVTLYFQMLEKGYPPNSFSFPPLVNAAARIPSLHDGEKCHGQVIKNGVDSVVYVQNSLVHMYGICGLVTGARQLFDEMSERDLVSWNSMVDVYARVGDLMAAHQLFDKMPERNSVSWNTMIAAYLQKGNPGWGLKLFREMQRVGCRATATTVVSTVTACGRSIRLKEGKSVHGFMIKSCLEVSLILGTALVDMYCKCGMIGTARQLFDKMPERNVPCWNAMIVGHGIHGRPEDALALFSSMVERVPQRRGNDDGAVIEGGGATPDEVTFVGVLCACARAGLVSEGKKYLEQMIDTYNIEPKFAHHWCMANLYFSVGLVHEADEVLKGVPQGSESVVWSGLLGACRFGNGVDLGEQMAKRLIELEPYNGSRYALLWNVYAMAGRWEDVARVKEMMNERRVRNVPGSSLVDSNKFVHEFRIGDRSQPQIDKIYVMGESVKRLELDTGHKNPLEDIEADSEHR